MPTKKRVFLSFIEEDKERVSGLRFWLRIQIMIWNSMMNLSGFLSRAEMRSMSKDAFVKKSTAQALRCAS